MTAQIPFAGDIFTKSRLTRTTSVSIILSNQKNKEILSRKNIPECDMSQRQLYGNVTELNRIILRATHVEE